MLIADFGGGTSDFFVQLQPSRKTPSSVIGTDGVGIAGDTFDSKIVRNLVAPMLGLGSKYKSQFGKILPSPNWLHTNISNAGTTYLFKDQEKHGTAAPDSFPSLEPQKIDALIDLVDHDLGYRLFNPS